MLGWRLCLLGTIIVAVLIGLFWLDAQAGDAAPVLGVLALSLALRSTWELVQLLRVRLQPQFAVTACCVLAIVASNWLWLLWPQNGALQFSFAARLGPGDAGCTYWRSSVALRQWHGARYGSWEN